MKRSTLTASLAAALLAAAAATPALAQATTYPEGTDCSAISSAASRMECMNQMNESRQVPNNGTTMPNQNDTGTMQPAVPGSGTQAPSAAPTAPGGPTTVTPAPSGGATQPGGETTTTP